MARDVRIEIEHDKRVLTAMKDVVLCVSIRTRGDPTEDALVRL